MTLVVFPTAWVDFLPDTLVSPDVAVILVPSINAFGAVALYDALSDHGLSSWCD